MYYEEKIINGVLMCRYDPKSAWQQFSIERMSKRIMKQKFEIATLEERVNNLEKEVEAYNNKIG